MLPTPPAIVWEDCVSEFLDELVEFDIGYMEVQMAVERVIQHGIYDLVSTQFEFEGLTLRYHRVPPLTPMLSPLAVFTHDETEGRIRVVFAHLE
jgi:hypothetical protein